MPYVTALNRRQLSAAIVEMAGHARFTHAITLNANREAIRTEAHSVGLQEKFFRAFCYRVDLHAFGKKRIYKLPTGVRFEAIAFPEHLHSNPHMHVAANLNEQYWGRQFDESQHAKLESIWHTVTKGSGSLKILGVRDRGWAKYMAKETFRHDFCYFLSQDFHNRDR